MVDMHVPLRQGVLFAVGGALYYLVEVLWRGHSDWTMAVLGGVCFLLIGRINERCEWCVALLSQMVLASLIVTTAEFCAGMVLNIWLELGIWDYSGMPYNLCGQVCLLYTNLWFLLSLPAIVLDDWLRHWWFGERKPAYKLL